MSIDLPQALSQELTRALEEAIKFDDAEKGLLQIYDRRKEVLRLAAHRGFQRPFLELFSEVRAFDASACGRALGVRMPVIISDVMTDVALSKFREIIKAEGFRSVKAVPLISDQLAVVGVLSTHFFQPDYLRQEKGKIPSAHLSKITALLEKAVKEMEQARDPYPES